MKTLRFLPVLGLLLSGCSAALISTNEELDKGSNAPKRTMDMAKNVETDSYISQINTVLGQIKNDNEGKAPATIEEAKAAVKFPDTMWIDGETGKPLVYDPATGTVSRAPK
jgi:predicted RND superfamily exporter protein